MRADITTIGSPAPGWALPPTQYRPRQPGTRLGGRSKAAVRELEEAP